MLREKDPGNRQNKIAQEDWVQKIRENDAFGNKGNMRALTEWTPTLQERTGREEKEDKQWDGKHWVGTH